jgi:hypothetical protein
MFAAIASLSCDKIGDECAEPGRAAQLPRGTHRLSKCHAIILPDHFSAQSSDYISRTEARMRVKLFAARFAKHLSAGWSEQLLDKTLSDPIGITEAAFELAALGNDLMQVNMRGRANFVIDR